MSSCFRRSFLFFVLSFCCASISVHAQESTSIDFEQAYASHITSLLRKYCHECHSGDLTEAELDFGEFKTTEEIRKGLPAWIAIRRMLDSRQMPPPEADQPSDAEFEQLQTWVKRFLLNEAKVHAGDPGEVPLRRLSNSEYTYTIRDLTGVDTLDPTREFPVDGAAGEGFTNVGSGQGMSPAFLQKYLDAGKEIASHAVLTPDGIRFSAKTTRRDHVDELMANVQAFYRRYTADGGGVTVNLDGRPFTTNQGGRLPVENYLRALLQEQGRLSSGQTNIGTVAQQYKLSEKYLTQLWQVLGSEKSTDSLLFKELHRQWGSATPADAEHLTAYVAKWQEKLWKFYPVGHYGLEDGPKHWMGPVSPVETRQELRIEIPHSDVEEGQLIRIFASDLGDGNDSDFVVLEQPRIVFSPDASGRMNAPLMLRDLRSIAANTQSIIDTEVSNTAGYLSAIAEAWQKKIDPGEVADAAKLNQDVLTNWSKMIGLHLNTKREIVGHLRNQQVNISGYQALNGWNSGSLPSILTNKSDEEISFSTITVPPRSVAVHPLPEVESIVAWRCPVEGEFSITGFTADADDKCGNGVAWRLEHLSINGKRQLSAGTFDNGTQAPLEIEGTLQLKAGDVLSVVINSRDNSHVCDTTRVELEVTEVGGEQRRWNLAKDVVDRILEGNPLPDSYGNAEVWHFCSSENQAEVESVIPVNSALDRWHQALIQQRSSDEVNQLAQQVQEVLTSASPSGLPVPDQELRERYLAWTGPLHWIAIAQQQNANSASDFGLPVQRFGRHPNGSEIRATDLCVQAPNVLEFRVPRQLTGNAVFTCSAVLHPQTGSKGTVQLNVANSPVEVALVSGDVPLLVGNDPRTAEELESGLAEFRNLFPPALCYARIVPVDEVVTLELFHREDEHLLRLMLNEEETAHINRLWDELLFVAQEPFELSVAYEQISEFATQDRPDLVKKLLPLQTPILERAEEFRIRLQESEPIHLQAVIDLAQQAWRHRLTESEGNELRQLYSQLRQDEIQHAPAIRLVLARVFTSPAFLFKLEEPNPGSDAAPVRSQELATRLSYFLWSSLPDATLQASAVSGRLVESAELRTQTLRMLDHPNTRRLAVQFACQWLHLRDFDKNDDKNEQLYPEFAELRGPMYEETVRFFENLFRNNGSILDVLDADHTFVNPALAKHYGIGDAAADDWSRIENVKVNGRGGVLGMAAFLSAQSGASRTSPILRGNWVYETLLGERLPRPPANVPQLPEEVPEGLTARQLIELHSSAPGCVKCHEKIDPYGFSLEQFDAIGRLRPKTVDTTTTLPNGDTISGLNGLRDYLLQKRQNDFVQQFCRKLLGFAIGREVQLSDEILLMEMQDALKKNEFRFHTAVELIVMSDQFRKIRGSR